ncbi:MAG: cobalt ABC transporter permease [Halobacteriales archaeon SW_9_67_25]|jgi:biotin transport system permease protein|nr:MAG: cobalt ABC transporter permease [Halobacteriales archaeon SW_9_67_25]
MLTYEPDATLAHRLDPRSKLLAQLGFAVAVFARGSALALGALTGLALVVLAAARLSPVRVLRAYWFVVVLLAVTPLFAAVRFGPPWLAPLAAVDSVVAGYRIVLVLFVSGAYVRTTPVRATRAAIQRHLPGRPGQLLGVGVGLVFRFFPLVLADLRSSQAAIAARAGDRRSALDRTRRLALVGLMRALDRADRLALALRARCFAYNPTLPPLAFSRLDYPVLVVGVALAVSPLL